MPTARRTSEGRAPGRPRKEHRLPNAGMPVPTAAFGSGATRPFRRPERLAMRIAMISEHASPLAAVGGIDAGGQNVYVAHVARCLVEQGHAVDVFTRRDDADAPHVVDLQPGLRVIHVTAGPAAPVPKEQLLDHMPQFARFCAAWFETAPRYDVIHANFFMSGWVGLQLKQAYGTPLVTTFHALGLVRRA